MMRFTLVMLGLMTSLSATAADKQFAGDDLDKLMRESGELPPRGSSEPIPKEFLDQKIIVVGKDGKPMSEFERTKWKIVPREDKPKKAVVKETPKELPKCEVIAAVPPPPPKTVEKIVTVEKRLFTHHNVTAYVGYGYDGLKTTYDSDRDVIIDNKKNALLGLGYSYKFNYEWNASALYISNQSSLVGAGYSW